MTQKATLGSISLTVTSAPFYSREHPAIIFVNPLAGRGRAHRNLAEIEHLFAANSFPAEFRFPQSAAQMSEMAHEGISSGAKLLVAMGGDGTLQVLVNAARNTGVVLGVIPAGGGNDFAAALGLPRDPTAAAKALISAQPRDVDVLRARCGDGAERLYLGGGGIGLDAETARYSTAYSWMPGRGRYLAGALRALRGFTPPQVRAEFQNGEPPTIGGKFLVSAVLNTPTYGGGLRLAPGARIDDGLLTAVFVRDLSAAQVCGAVPRLLFDGTLPDSYVRRVSARRVRLVADGGCLFHGDGEIIGPVPVEIEVMPKALRILVPAAR